uniref:Family with sequence similarity 174 member B n=1 Tax=Scophthalmus maximus TaxID=52904 RepID=A0A8D3CCL5_SCOMX
MVKYNLALTFLAAALWRVGGEPQTLSSPATHFNATSPSITSGHALANITDAAVGSRMSSLMTHLPALKNIVIFICVLTAVLITCLVIRVVRSGRRIRKTRKYDIITTPAERVEMAPLNEENDDEDDSTLFDIKYRLVLVSFSFLSDVSTALMRMTKRSNHIEEVRPLIPYGFSGHADHCV